VKWFQKQGSGQEDQPHEMTGWRRRILHGTEQTPEEELKRAQEILQWAQRKHDPDSPFTIKAMIDVADQLAIMDRFGEEIELREQIVVRLGSSVGPDSLSAASAEMKLAGCLVQLERFNEVDGLLAHVVAVRSRELGPDDPDTLRAVAWRDMAAGGRNEDRDNDASPAEEHPPQN
jgi:hypothetical protein